MSESGAALPVKVEIGATAKANLDIKGEIPSSAMGRLAHALADAISPFTERRGLKGDQLRLQREDTLLLVTFGGNGFDLPLLRYRAFALGVPVPGLHGGCDRDYWHRFGQDHVDLCDVFSGYGASAKPSLAEMAALANVPVKIGGVHGSQVEAYVAAGRLTDVADYCLTDVLATYCVFLRYGMVRGDLTPAHLNTSMDSLRATVQKHVERRPLLSAFLK
jgi:predicted PolB exonuclease-like 3'-5' exonuclease